MVMRIFFDPTQKTALIRLRASIEASPAPFYLQITPDQIHSLTLHHHNGPISGPVSSAYLDLRLTAAVGAVIAREGPLPELSTSTDYTKLQRFRQLATQCTLHVLMPAPAGTTLPCDKLRQLQAVCEALGQGGFRADPDQADLKKLYYGRGGRLVPSTEPWHAPAGAGALPPSSLFVAHHATADLPTYVEEVVPAPQSTQQQSRSRPQHADTRKRKRKRSSSPADRFLPPPSVSVPPPEYSMHGHLDSGAGVSGEHEKLMAELLRNADEQKRALQQMILQLNTSLTRAEGVIAKLTSLASDQRQDGGEGAAPTLFGDGPTAVRQQLTQRPEQVRSSQRSTLSPPLSTPLEAGASPTVSATSSTISGRVQAYLADQLDQLRNEIADNYVCNEAFEEALEQRVADEVDGTMSRFVEEHEMFEAIREAIDGAMASFKDVLVAALRD